jgi:SOS-response transcriptional repressor LexA
MTIAYTFGDAQPEVPALKEHAEALSGTDDRRSKMALYIGRFWQDHRYGPTLREIQSELAVKSLTTIRADLENLSGRGLVTYQPNQSRTLVPTDILLAQV